MQGQQPWHAVLAAGWRVCVPLHLQLMVLLAC
jgi:hypothetical protein